MPLEEQRIMTFDATTTVAEIARSAPATIKVFQQHAMDFCCGGRIPLAEACEAAGLNTGAILAELDEATRNPTDARDWTAAPLTELIRHIQERYHLPLRDELPRLSGMMAKVVQRHGDRMPDVLPRLQETLEALHHDLLRHMRKEDVVLFPAIARTERGVSDIGGHGASWSFPEPLSAMEAEHAAAGAALSAMRSLTNGYMPPDDACPTWRGLYYGLADLERTMHEHVHLENNILFPRALALV
jgi:regulator of cell morphogenesis and NO signaling